MLLLVLLEVFDILSNYTHKPKIYPASQIHLEQSNYSQNNRKSKKWEMIW